MTPELKARWIAALESGRYVQGAGFLRTADNKFCCLGVLCDVVEPRNWNDVEEIGSTIAGESISKTAYAHRMGRIELDSNARIEAGLTISQHKTLIELNDAGRPFSQIAEYIRQHVV